MKTRFVTALALSLALGQVAVTSASAAQPVAPAAFRTATPQAFTNADLQRYGLSAADASQVEKLQAEGKTVKVMTADEAKRYTGGEMSTTSWILIGALVVVIIAVAAD